MNDFEKSLAEVLGEENLIKIQKARVGIAGAGGLGSNCVLFLVRCGFRKLRIVDSDVVEMSNLNRQFYFSTQVGEKKVEALRENLLRINPDLEIETFDERIENGNVGTLFSECDVVVEALDGAADKKMVVEAYMNSGKLVVAASGIAGWGESDAITIHRIRDNFFLVGDLSSEAAPGLPPMAPRVNIAAAKQADVILTYFLRNPDRGLHND
ncbi:MAG: sulfur carrier protein ThiS adenylyltransferase ThiF [Deltaproteobacteria bacterium]|nr:sulfur carrier protein ThiS adenylyltransferase ThiF [Deltaproteobacteria bacterium]